MTFPNPNDYEELIGDTEIMINSNADLVIQDRDERMTRYFRKKKPLTEKCMRCSNLCKELCSITGQHSTGAFAYSVCLKCYFNIFDYLMFKKYHDENKKVTK